MLSSLRGSEGLDFLGFDRLGLFGLFLLLISSASLLSSRRWLRLRSKCVTCRSLMRDLFNAWRVSALLAWRGLMLGF